MIGELLSAGSKLAGGVLSMFGAKSAQKRAQKVADSAVQRRVADAQKAGVHPLYALGANLTQPPPINTFADLGSSVSDMGQDISRAVAAGGTVEDRAIRALQLKRADLENQLLTVQIKNASAPAVGPGSPIGVRTALPSQGDSVQPVHLPDWLGGGILPAQRGVHSGQYGTNQHGEIYDIPAGGNFLEQLIADPKFREKVKYELFKDFYKAKDLVSGFVGRR